MTPNDAQIILKSVEASGEDLGIGYRLALETIAGMREEYGVMYEYSGDGQPAYFYRWTDIYDVPLDYYAARSIAERKKRYGYDNVRIVRRYFTDPKEIA